MALNKYMHPRNIYKNPPDFGKLSKLFPEFNSIAKMDVAGRVNINFKDPHSLRVLSKCLLKSDFNIEVDIPEDRLVPTLPLRLNYILWIEDILNGLKKQGDIWGLDIGTGACAIYPLLGSTKNKWHMVGTETDDLSFEKAHENIQKNNLQSLIQLRKNSTTSIIEHLFIEDQERVFDFSMCNPPFYSSIQELYESRSPARLPPKNGFTGSPQELITEGGELEFSRKYIKESQIHKDRVLVYTTMIGHKYNLKELLQDLRTAGIKHTHTEFCQGHVTRWGLAWTYQDYDIYKIVPPRDQTRKKSQPILYLLPRLPDNPYDLESVTAKLKHILNNLQISYKVIDKRGSNIIFDVIATTNTWSNQRRKRRQMKRMEAEQSKKLKSNDEKVVDVEIVASPAVIVENCDSPCSVSTSTKTETVQLENIKKENQSTSSEPCIEVHSTLRVFRKDKDVLMEMEYLNGRAGKEGLHQIVQFIKNNWK